MPALFYLPLAVSPLMYLLFASTSRIRTDPKPVGVGSESREVYSDSE